MPSSAKRPVSSPALVDASDVTKAAHTAHQALHDAISNINALWMIAAESCYHLREGHGWQHLGHDTLNEYLAQPEITMERGRFLALASIWEHFHIRGGVPVEQLAAAPWTKLRETIRALNAGCVTVEEALSDAQVLGRRDLTDRYKEMSTRGDTPSGPGASTPDFAEFVSRVEIHPSGRDDALELVMGDRRGLLHRDVVVRVYNELGRWLGAVA